MYIHALFYRDFIPQLSFLIYATEHSALLKTLYKKKGVRELKEILCAPSMEPSLLCEQSFILTID